MYINVLVQQLKNWDPGDFCLTIFHFILCSIGNTASLDISWSLDTKVFRPVWTSTLCLFLQYLSTLDTLWNLFLWYLPSSAFLPYSDNCIVSEALSHSLYWEFSCSDKFFWNWMVSSKVIVGNGSEKKDAGRQFVWLCKPSYFIIRVWSPMCITWDSLCSCSLALQVHSVGVAPVTNAGCQLWKMKTAALNADILALSCFKVSNQFCKG